MRTVLLGLLLVPLAVWAQFSFDPVRLDNAAGEDYYYPHIELADGNLLCTWSSTSETVIAAHGRHVAPDGQLLGTENYQEIAQGGVIWCPANLFLLHAADGSDPYMTFHS